MAPVFVALFAACANRNPAPPKAPGDGDPSALLRSADAFRQLEQNILEKRARVGGNGERFKPLFGVVPLDVADARGDDATARPRETLLRELGKLPPAEDAERTRLERFLEAEAAREAARIEHGWLGESLRAMTRRAAAASKDTTLDDGAIAKGLRASLGKLTRATPSLALLDDAEIAIDLLERETARGGFSDTLRVIVPLREEIDRKRPSARVDWRIELDVASRLIGAPLPTREALEQELATLQRDLRSAISERAKAASPDAEQRAAASTRALLFDDGECFGTSATGVLARVGFAPEHLRFCRVLHVVGDAPDELAVLYALHDAVALARWALHSGPSDPRPSHLFVCSPGLDEEERLARLSSANRPDALAAGLGALRLWKGGLQNARAKASKWLAYGDARLSDYAD